MAKCKTIALLEHLAAEHSELKQVASSAMDIVENIQECGISDIAIEYLHLLVDAICKAGDISLLDHLRDGGDCAPCREMAKRIHAISA